MEIINNVSLEQLAKLAKIGISTARLYLCRAEFRHIKSHRQDKKKMYSNIFKQDIQKMYEMSYKQKHARKKRNEK